MTFLGSACASDIYGLGPSLNFGIVVPTYMYINFVMLTFLTTLLQLNIPYVDHTKASDISFRKKQRRWNLLAFSANCFCRVTKEITPPPPKMSNCDWLLPCLMLSFVPYHWCIALQKPNKPGCTATEDG